VTKESSMGALPVTKPPRRADVVPLRDATKVWFAISLQTFGGPAGQIAVMQRALVDERRWIGQQRFLHALNYCMLLPGPEAQQLAIYIGWLLNGTAGGLIAGTLFVLPGLVALLALSAVYVSLGTTTAVTGLFIGLAAAVLSVVVQALIRVGRRALGHPAMLGLAAAAFVALAVFSVPFPIVVGGAAGAGWLLGRFQPQIVHHTAAGHGADDAGPAPLIADDALHDEHGSWKRSLRVLAFGVVVWLLPLAVAALATGRHSTLTTEGSFFSGTALVTFGWAYAVLAYVAQRAVEAYGWLSAREMVRGLGLAETTPGPLIMVVVFVAFLGAYRQPGALSPWAAAVIASLLVTWATFVPCFVFIFLGAPYVERLRGNQGLGAALAGITAAVVGVIGNLSYYFAVHTLWRHTTTIANGPLHLTVPHLGSLRPASAAIAAVAAALTFRLNWSVLRVLGLCAALGLLAALLGFTLT
jgi:chromate transporter